MERNGRKRERGERRKEEEWRRNARKRNGEETEEEEGECERRTGRGRGEGVRNGRGRELGELLLPREFWRQALATASDQRLPFLAQVMETHPLFRFQFQLKGRFIFVLQCTSSLAMPWKTGIYIFASSLPL